MAIKPVPKMLVVKVIDKPIMKKDGSDFEIETKESRGLKRVGIEEGRNRGKVGLVSYISDNMRIPNTDFHMIREEEIMGFVEEDDEV